MGNDESYKKSRSPYGNFLGASREITNPLFWIRTRIPCRRAHRLRRHVNAFVLKLMKAKRGRSNYVYCFFLIFTRKHKCIGGKEYRCEQSASDAQPMHHARANRGKKIGTLISEVFTTDPQKSLLLSSRSPSTAPIDHSYPSGSWAVG